MQFTIEQFDSLELDDWELGTFKLNKEPNEFKLAIFNWLPSHIQSLAVAWGASDSVFRDNSIVHILEKQCNMTYEEYTSCPRPKLDFDFSK